MAELQRIKLQPGDLAGYMNTWKEKPKVIDVSRTDGEYTGPSGITKSSFGPPTTSETSLVLINQTLLGFKKDPIKNNFSINIHVNKGVLDASRSNGSIEVTIDGLIDGVRRHIKQTDYREIGNNTSDNPQITVYDFDFIPIISGKTQRLLESSDGHPLFRVISDGVDEIRNLSIIQHLTGKIRPCDFREPISAQIENFSGFVGLYNERALSSMDFNILAGMANTLTN